MLDIWDQSPEVPVVQAKGRHSVVTAAKIKFLLCVSTYIASTEKLLPSRHFSKTILPTNHHSWLKVHSFFCIYIK